MFENLSPPQSLCPPAQDVESVLDFMRLHNPVLAITWATQNPSEFQALPSGKRRLLIECARAHQMQSDAWLLQCLQTGAKEPEPDVSDTPELKAHFHPMRNVLITIKTVRSLLDLVEEQLFLTQDQLGAIVESVDDPGINEADEERLEQFVTCIHTLDDDLGDLSGYFRDLVGIV